MAQFDEGVIEQLVMLGYSRDECIAASKLVTNVKDINAVQDKLNEMLEKEAQEEIEADFPDDALEQYAEWKCPKCDVSNQLYFFNCTTCKTPCDISLTIEPRIKGTIKVLFSSNKSWTNIKEENIRLQKIDTALSSKLYIISTENSAEKFIFRIYNPSTTSDLHSEIQSLFSNKLQIGPRQIAKCSFAQIEEYLDSRQSERIDDLFGNQSINEHVATFIARIHSSSLEAGDSTKSTLRDGAFRAMLLAQSKAFKVKENRDDLQVYIYSVYIYIYALPPDIQIHLHCHHVSNG